MKGDFQSRLREALRRRLYPNAPLHLKEIAAAIGRADNTVMRWWRGETAVTGSDLDRLAQFFAQIGDSGFLRDVFSNLGVQPAADSPPVSAIALARAVLTEAGEPPQMGRDRDLWIIASGQMNRTVLDHSRQLSTELKLPHNHGDPVGYAIRVLGWIAITERTDGSVVVRHSSRRIAPLAAERACEWLEANADRISRIERLILTSGNWVEAHHQGANAAAEAIASAAFINKLQRRHWQTKRLSLDLITLPMLQSLLRVHNEAPDNLVHAAAEIGAFTTSSLFGVDGDDVVCYHIGTSLGFDRRVEGLNVLARPDTEYALALRDRVLGAHHDGPAFYELTGMIDDRYARYFNLTLPAGSAPARVLTSSVVLEVERLSA